MFSSYRPDKCKNSYLYKHNIKPMESQPIMSLDSFLPLSFFVLLLSWETDWANFDSDTTLLYLESSTTAGKAALKLVEKMQTIKLHKFAVTVDLLHQQGMSYNIEAMTKTLAWMLCIDEWMHGCHARNIQKQVEERPSAGVGDIYSIDCR